MEKEVWNKPLRICDIGGSALIEGVMMRGNDKMSSAVRKVNGEILIETEDYISIGKRYSFFKLPIIRGAVGMIESMVVSMRVLMSSAEKVEFEDEEEEVKESKFENFLKKVFGDKFFKVILYFSVVVALVFGIGFFILLPNALATLLSLNKENGAITSNLIEGLIRITLFVSYIFLVSRNKEIKRVFQYHGAEHKAIHAYENKEELTVENVRKHTTLHPRCGTTFMFVAIIISIVLFSLVGRYPHMLVNMAIRLALLPLVAGISYELFKKAARSSIKPVKLLSYPGLLLQKITTQNPDDSQIEVAIAALKQVVGEEKEQIEDNIPLTSSKPTWSTQ